MNSCCDLGLPESSTSWICVPTRNVITGVLTALILTLVGVKAEDIVEDYSLSANVYAEMDDHQAIVGALSQRSLDPKTFLGAPPQDMADLLKSIEENEVAEKAGFNIEDLRFDGRNLDLTRKHQHAQNLQTS